MYPADPNSARAIHAFLFLLPIVIVVVATIVLVPTWRICKKAGFTPWLSLLIFVPLGNLILLYVLAFSDWRVIPIEQLGWPAYPPQYGGQYPPGYPPGYPPQNPPQNPPSMPPQNPPPQV